MNEPNIVGGTQLAGALSAGVTNISYNQTVEFSRYVRVVLPVDGFVFWVRAPLLLGGAGAFNRAIYNGSLYNDVSQPTDGSASTLNVQGSLHYSTQAQQDETASAAVNSVIFTAKSEVTDLNTVNPDELWVSTLADGVRYAFRERFKFYAQSGLYHYRGQALTAPFEIQLVENAAQLSGLEPIVSNSLPIWLANPPLPPAGGYIPVYPSFAVPANAAPPYIAVHIPPGSTTALQSMPLILQPSLTPVPIPPLAPGSALFNGMGFNTTTFNALGTGFVPLPRPTAAGNSWQLASDEVRFTAYGLNNAAVIDYQNQLLGIALDDEPGYPSPFGVMDMPIWRDEKQNQVEMQLLAQKKTFSMRVSYYQSRVTEIARQTIRSAVVRLTVANTGISFDALG